MLYFFALARGDQRREGESTRQTFNRGPSFDLVATRGARRRGNCTSWCISNSTKSPGGGGAWQECDLPGLGVRPAKQFDVGHPLAKILSRLHCWITCSWRIVSHFARMWAGGVGGKLRLLQPGGQRGVYTQQSKGRGGVDEFGAARNRIMGRMVGCI
jgi:hypothetical protein